MYIYEHNLFEINICDLFDNYFIIKIIPEEIFYYAYN